MDTWISDKDLEKIKEEFECNKLMIEDLRYEQKILILRALEYTLPARVASILGLSRQYVSKLKSP